MRTRSGAATWPGFAAWLLVGAALGFAIVSFVVLALPLVIVVALLALRPGLRRSGFGLVSGLGVVPLYVAFLQRRGPGTVCWHTATASGCDEYLNPWPWLVIGLTLVSIGVVAHVRRLRQERAAADVR